MEIFDHHCPVCQSGELRPGKPPLGPTFYPEEGQGVFAAGFSVRSFVCLGCGFVGHYVPPDELGRLKQKLSGPS